MANKEAELARLLEEQQREEREKARLEKEAKELERARKEEEEKAKKRVLKLMPAYDDETLVDNTIVELGGLTGTFGKFC